MKTDRSRRDIVLIGGSSGSFEALKTIVSVFPADLHASVFIVLHTRQSSAYIPVPDIFNRNGRLPALNALDKLPVLSRRIYIAPPGRHLILNGDCIRLSLGPRENLHRPSIDALFRSGATAYGKRVIAVVLSGYLDDGAVGLAAVKDQGGIAIVQDPKDASVPDMPRSALRAVDPDFILPASRIGNTIVELVQKPRSATAITRRT
jgi:two-component system chemotaxis response regulator CheB